VLVPVPAAEDLVGRWRRLYDPVANAGVPAHITLIVPWIPPWKISDDHLLQLAEVLEDVAPFDFELTELGWFGRRVLWVAPKPAEPFLVLTARLARQFGTPPWAGEFDQVVPHLTIAHSPADPSVLDPVSSDVAERLPVACRADEVWVMGGDGTRWSVRAKVALEASEP
jgi:2'-5' RNA ligase